LAVVAQLLARSMKPEQARQLSFGEEILGNAFLDLQRSAVYGSSPGRRTNSHHGVCHILKTSERWKVFQVPVNRKPGTGNRASRAVRFTVYGSRFPALRLTFHNSGPYSPRLSSPSALAGEGRHCQKVRQAWKASRHPP